MFKDVRCKRGGDLTICEYVCRCLFDTVILVHGYEKDRLNESNNGFWHWYMIMDMIKILDIIHYPRLKTHNVSEAGSASISSRNVETREPTQVGVLERGILTFWTWNEVQKKYTYS